MEDLYLVLAKLDPELGTAQSQLVLFLMQFLGTVKIINNKKIQ